MVVGGDIAFRLDVRQQLLRDGFRVTIVRSPRRGLAQLRRHSFATCVLEISAMQRNRQMLQEYRRESERAGTSLSERGERRVW